MCVHFGTKLGSSILLEHMPKHLLRTLNEHPKVRPATRFIKATRDETFVDLEKVHDRVPREKL